MKTLLSLTAVAYESGDLIGYFLAYCSLIPLALIVAEATVLFFAESRGRRVEAGLLFAGQWLNEGLNWLLKHFIKGPRPDGAYGRIDYGMPSSHSQFMGYFLCVAWMLAASKRAEQVPFTRYSRLIWPLRLALAAGSGLVWISRFYLGYHTIEQVVVGAMAGAVFGLAFYRACLMCSLLGNSIPKSE